MVRKIFIFFFLIFLVMLCYGNNLNSFFVSDDWNWFPQISGINPVSLYKIFLPEKLGGIASSYFRPLNPFFFWLNLQIGGFNPFSFHLTNLLLHLLNILLVYSISQRVIRQKTIVLLVTFFFAVFPLHSEAVAWVSGLIDVLSCFLYLLSLLSGLIYLEGGKKRYLVYSLVIFVLALLTKENTVTLPLVLFILGKKVRFVDVKYYLLIIILWLVLKFYFSPVFLGPLSYQGFFLSRLFVIYLVLLVIGFIFTKIFLKYRKLFKFWIVLGIVMLPTAFLPTEERYLYLPSAFIVLFTGKFLVIFPQRKFKKLIYFSLMIIILISSLVLYQRNQRWMTAGKIARNAISQLKNSTTKKDTDLYFLSLPDNFEGAYLFRTHFDLGLKYNGVLFNNVYVLAMTNGVGETQLTPVEKNTYLIKSSKQFIVFYPSVSKSPSNNQFEIKNNYATVLLDNNKNTALIKLNIKNNNFRLFYFNKDRLVEFP